MKMFTIKTTNNEFFNVPVLYKTDNLVLHRHYTILKNNLESKTRHYTITWHNDKGDIYSLFSLYNMRLKRIYTIMNYIQSKGFNLNLKHNELASNSEFKSLCLDFRNKPELTFYKISPLYEALNN